MSYLYVLTKQEFTSLYRFGQIPLVRDNIIKSKGISKEKVSEELFNRFMNLPYFVGDEEYIIISYDKPLGEDNRLEIKDITEIIPLTKVAKNSFQMKFDKKINFKEARYEAIVHKVEEAIDVQEMYSGAKAFWDLCKINKPFNTLLDPDILSIAYRKRINGIKSHELKEEDFNTHVLVYNRYEFFPNTDLGFYYDVGEIFAHFKGKPSFIGSGFHSFLEKNKQKLSKKPFIEISDSISNSKEIENFKEQLTNDELKQYVAVAIFLKFKEDLGERDTIKGSDTGKLIAILKNKDYYTELEMAIYLTGAFFGYKKFYDDLYDLAELKIFKKGIKPNKTSNKQKDEAKVKIKTVSNVKIVSDSNKSPEQSIPNIKKDDLKDKKKEKKGTSINQPQEPKESKNITSIVGVDQEDAANKSLPTQSTEPSNSVSDIILEFVKKRTHSKIKPDIMDHLKDETLKSYTIKEIEEIIRLNLIGELELKKKGQSKGVRLIEINFSNK